MVTSWLLESNACQIVGSADPALEVRTAGGTKSGAEQRNWSGTTLSQPNEKQSGILTSTTSDGKSFAIEFHPAKSDATDWEAHVALLGSEISTNVRAGENSGRNLKHDFVVLDLEQAEMKSDAGSQRASLTIKAPAETGSRKAVAIWVTPRGQLGPVQATGGWLP